MKKVCVLLADGFEESEVVVPVDLLRRGGVEVILTGVNGKSAVSSHGIRIEADALLSEIDAAAADLLFVPGGLGGINGILASKDACTALKTAAANGKWLAAICAGPTVLSRLGLIDARNAVCYPGMEELLVPAVPHPECSVLQDGRLLTARAAGAAFDLGLKMVEVLVDTDTAQGVRASVCYEG